MSFIKKVRIIQRVDSLIRRRATGSPRELASRLNVSESTVYNIINLIKEMGGPVCYSIHSNSYYYEYEVELKIGFLRSDRDFDKVQGGKELFYFDNFPYCKIFGVNPFIFNL